MADEGFKLDQPQPGTAPQQPSGESTTPSIPIPSDILAPAGMLEAPTMKAVGIGLGILLLVMIGLFFLKNAFANQQVARKVSPRSANAAGWWLFMMLVSIAAIVIFGAINSSYFLSLLFVGPALAAALFALVMMLLSIRVK